MQQCFINELEMLASCKWRCINRIIPRYGVCLVGVVTGKEAERVTLINPGCDYILHESDICLYLSLAKEETAAVIKSGKKVIENKAASICEKEMIEQGKIGKAKDQYNMAACRLEQVGR